MTQFSWILAIIMIKCTEGSFHFDELQITNLLSYIKLNGKPISQKTLVVEKNSKLFRNDSALRLTFFHLFHFQLYYSQFRDVGICLVNLVDDSQEYTRGLFFLM